MTIKTLGIDLAKNVFQLFGADAEGQCVVQRRARRESLLPLIETLPRCKIGVEACTGAFYWQRRFEALGHGLNGAPPETLYPISLSAWAPAATEGPRRAQSRRRVTRQETPWA